MKDGVFKGPDVCDWYIMKQLSRYRGNMCDCNILKYLLHNGKDLYALLLIFVFTSDPDIDIILITESQNQGTSVSIMAEGSNRGEYSTSPKRMRMDTGRITK